MPVVVEEDGKRRQLDLRDRPAVARFRGRDLEGLLYDRLFTYFAADVPGRVVLGSYVTSTDGTGLVHTAPPFGEDDYQTGQVRFAASPHGRRRGQDRRRHRPLRRPLVQGRRPRDHPRSQEPRPAPPHRPLPPQLSVLLALRPAAPLLRDRELVRAHHARKDRLVAENKQIGWHPEHIGEGRFGNWLENVVDWALSRRRYWGTPLPVWLCDRSMPARRRWSAATTSSSPLAGPALPADLYDRAQLDPHRPFVDDSPGPAGACGAGTMRRVADVIDAWFDSGAMPFAQHHYLGTALPQFDPGSGKGFPADFISEAVDQTRGWFYTLHALGVLLLRSRGPPTRHCIVLGHINDEQGRKMSKRLGNVIEPMAVIEETGADALRWYFCINNPEVPSRFSARLVREAAQGFLLPLWNALSFFTIYANLDGWHPGRAPEVPFAEQPDLDRWIRLRLEDEIRGVSEALDAYSVTPAAQRLEAFLDDLTNWYIRRSRDRFWSSWEEGGSAKESAYQTLHHVLATLARLIAPFTPFVAETLHRHLVRSQGPALESKGSVHLESWPVPHGELFAGEALHPLRGDEPDPPPRPPGPCRPQLAQPEDPPAAHRGHPGRPRPQGAAGGRALRRPARRASSTSTRCAGPSGARLRPPRGASRSSPSSASALGKKMPLLKDAPRRAPTATPSPRSWSRTARSPWSSTARRSSSCPRRSRSS